MFDYKKYSPDETARIIEAQNFDPSQQIQLQDGRKLALAIAIDTSGSTAAEVSSGDGGPRVAKSKLISGCLDNCFYEFATSTVADGDGGIKDQLELLAVIFGLDIDFLRPELPGFVKAEELLLSPLEPEEGESELRPTWCRLRPDGPTPQCADTLRYGDDPRGRLLQRHRELRPSPGRASRRGQAVHPHGLLP